MKLQLKKPLCFFDLETTGTDISKDRIIEIAILKLYPDGKKETLETRINPEIPIPIEASMVHGITDQMVIDQPSFKEVSKKIYAFIKGCDLAGFNSDRFDIPLLVEELLRAELFFVEFVAAGGGSGQPRNKVIQKIICILSKYVD